MNDFIFIQMASGLQNRDGNGSKPKWTDYAQLVVNLTSLLVAFLTYLCQ